MKFRKKPETVDAIQYTGKNEMDIYKFTGGAAIIEVDLKTITIKTDNGWLDAKPTDWIIKEINGKLDAVHNDIFIESYDEI